MTNLDRCRSEYVLMISVTHNRMPPEKVGQEAQNRTPLPATDGNAPGDLSFNSALDMRAATLSSYWIREPDLMGEDFYDDIIVAITSEV